MRRALIVALLLAAVIVVLALRSFHGPGDQPELRSAVLEVQSSSKPSALESHEPAIESANSVSTPSRERQPAETNASASSPAPAANATLLIKVLYAGSDRPVRAAKAIVEPSTTEGRTDERGVAELRVQEGEHLSKFRVEAGDDGDPFMPFEHNLDQVVQPGKNELLVRVDRGVDIRGIVREAGTGRAIPGAKVRYNGFGYRTDVESDKEGAFLCQALLVNFGNPNPLHIDCTGYLPASAKPQAADIQPGAPPLVVVLESGLTITGRVVDSRHEAVSGVSLELRALKAYHTVSDERGNFTFGGLTSADQTFLTARTQIDPPIFGRELELGALTASRSDVVLEVERAVHVQVFAELPDGSKIDSVKFAVDWGGNGTSADVLYFEDKKLKRLPTPHARIVPLGSDFELLAYTHAPGTDDPCAILSGSARVYTVAGTHSPHEVHVRLSEPSRLEIPPVPTGAGENRRYGSEPPGALDVQVLDAVSGFPVEAEHWILYTEDDSPAERLSTGPDGWVRLWRSIGTRKALVKYDIGPEQMVTITIPRSGYAKAVWRLKARP